MSIAGGLPRAVDRAALHGCESLQIFTKSAGQWKARPLPDAEVAEFRRRVAETGIRPVVAHASYLINLAAREDGLRRQSMDALAEELDRVEVLGLHGLVLHPGACTGDAEDEGIDRAATSLREVLGRRPRQKARVLLEHTAGQVQGTFGTDAVQPPLRSLRYTEPDTALTSHGQRSLADGARIGHRGHCVDENLTEQVEPARGNGQAQLRAGRPIGLRNPARTSARSRRRTLRFRVQKASLDQLLQMEGGQLPRDACHRGGFVAGDRVGLPPDVVVHDQA